MHDNAQAVARHVNYEWKMLKETYTLRRQRSSAPLPQSAKRAFTECFLLHARNLYHFLKRRRSELKQFEVGDVLAEDYFDQPSQWDVPTCLTFLDSNMTWLNRSLAHISYGRIEYERSKGWDKMDMILSELTHAWGTFVKALPEERREWFESPAR